MNPGDIRRRRQEAIIDSHEDYIIGHENLCPLAADELASLSKDHPLVKRVYSDGLTGQVFQVEVGGKVYNIKKRHPVIKVVGKDGQLSFLNELEVRGKLYEKSKSNSVIQRGIVKTLYGSLQKGILCSEWIEGGHVKEVTREQVRQLFTLLWTLEQTGLFEWDLCPGNILIDSTGAIKLFDFGYCYPMDPRNDINSDGLDERTFHLVERFETRFLMGHLLSKSLDDQLDIYRMVKEEGVRIYQEKLAWLQGNGGHDQLISWLQDLLDKWTMALTDHGALVKLYEEESFRSYFLDIMDDLKGQTCTKRTLEKIDRVIELLKKNYKTLADAGLLMWGDEAYTQDDLIERYKERRELALGYLVD